MFEPATVSVGLAPELVPVSALARRGGEQREARISDVVSLRGRSEAELAGLLRRVTALESELAAFKAEAIVALAGRRPNCLDVPAGRPGAAAPDWQPDGLPEFLEEEGVSEFFCDELALVLNCSRAEATRLAGTAHTLIRALPDTWAALADGRLDWPRARAIAAELGEPARLTHPAVVTAVEAVVLPVAAELSITRLRALIRRELLARDSALADARRRAAEKLADVTIRSGPDGLDELVAGLPRPVAAAVRETVDCYARMLKADGDPRPIGVLRAAVLADLVLRPWDTSRPPVTARMHLTVPVEALESILVERGEGAPVADLNGQPITAEQVRALLERLDALCPGGLQPPEGGELCVDFVDPDTGELRATADLAELRRIARRGCPDHPDRDEDCGCAVLGTPPAVDRYEPTPAQRRFVQARDRTCRWPGCHNPVGRTDIDHADAYADGGATDCHNLCCLCRRHHRLKTHAEGWGFVLLPDGTLSVTTPSGVTRTSRPPGWHLLAPRRVPDPDDDPPPF